jgi:hypothetical protein
MLTLPVEFRCFVLTFLGVDKHQGKWHLNPFPRKKTKLNKFFLNFSASFGNWSTEEET